MTKKLERAYKRLQEAEQAYNRQLCEEFPEGVRISWIALWRRTATERFTRRERFGVVVGHQRNTLLVRNDRGTLVRIEYKDSPRRV